MTGMRICGRARAAALALALLLLPAQAALAEAIVMTETLHGRVPVQTWKALRDEGVVKQDKDYSCGAASIATLLTHFYRQPTTELEILELLSELGKDKAATSFEDLSIILPDLGFRAVGLALSEEQLAKLKVPVIVFVRSRETDHFAVLSGVSPDRVGLADPALGNRTLTRAQFRGIWETRDDARLVGRALAVLPLVPAETAEDFFGPPQVSRVPYQLLTIRPD